MENSDMRYRRQWARGTFTGWESKNFLELPLEEQVLHLGWSHACPVVEDVINTYGGEWAKNNPSASPNQIREHGLLMTRARYAECNFVFGLIAETAKDIKPRLFEQLEKSVKRLPNEPVGILNSNFVPKSFYLEMPPLSTLWGYALPRVIIEEMGRGENNKFRTPERIVKSLKMIEKAVRTSGDPTSLVVKLSEMACEQDAEPKNVLSHLLSVGILKEENCKTMFGKVIEKMRNYAPTLTKAFDSLTPEEFKNFDIVSPDQLI